jgi:hypothetical protein
MIKIGIVLTIILLFLSIDVAPAITAYENESSSTAVSLQDSETNLVTLTCQYFTQHDITTMETQLPYEKVEHLMLLVKQNEYQKIASELTQLNLMPRSLTQKKVLELLNGHNRYELIHQLPQTPPNGCTDKLTNSFCRVSGYAVDSLFINTIRCFMLFSTFFLYTLDEFLLNLKLYPRIHIETPIWEWDLGLFGIFASLLGGYVFNIPSVRFPVRLSPLILSWMGDVRSEEYAILRTKSFHDEWSIENYGIGFLLVGFTGLWLTFRINDECNEPGCAFLGSSLYVSAKTYH